MGTLFGVYYGWSALSWLRVPLKWLLIQCPVHVGLNWIFCTSTISSPLHNFQMKKHLERLSNIQGLQGINVSTKIPI